MATIPLPLHQHTKQRQHMKLKDEIYQWPLADIATFAKNLHAIDDPLTIYHYYAEDVWDILHELAGEQSIMSFLANPIYADHIDDEISLFQMIGRIAVQYVCQRFLSAKEDVCC